MHGLDIEKRSPPARRSTDRPSRPPSRACYEVETHDPDLLLAKIAVRCSVPAGSSQALLAHGIGGREDLPLPLGWAVAGAAVAVVVSFVALGAAVARAPAGGRGRGPAAARLGWRRARLPGDPRSRWPAVGLLATGWTLLALVLGPDDARTTRCRGWSSCSLWVGAGAALGAARAGLAAAQPAAHRARRCSTGPRGSTPRTASGRCRPGSAGGPPRSVWSRSPGSSWCDPDSTTLPALRWAIGLYAAVHLVAALRLRQPLVRPRRRVRGVVGALRADRRRSDAGRTARSCVRAPLAGLDAVAPAPRARRDGRVMLGSTAYDGLSGSTAWVRVRAVAAGAAARSSARRAARHDRRGRRRCSSACTLAAGRLGGADDVRALPGLPSRRPLVPVALGYVVAHYYSFLVLEGQNARSSGSPTRSGTGADWLGTAGLQPCAALVTPDDRREPPGASPSSSGTCSAWCVAHDRAVRLFPRRHGGASVRSRCWCSW